MAVADEETNVSSGDELSAEELARLRKEWFDRVSSVISYRYLGCFSMARGRHEAEGGVRIRSDMRGPVGLLAGPMGVTLLDTAGINVDPLAQVSPTRIDVNLFEPAADVKAVIVHGTILREGKTQYFTEGRIYDAGDRTRVIGIGSCHWAVGDPNPGFNYVDQRPGVPESPDLPPIYEPYGAHLLDDGALEIPELREDLGSRGLHQGPLQIVPEAAAMMAAQKATGTTALWIEHQGTSIVARGLGAPFRTSAEVLRVAEGSVNVRVELRAMGNDARLITTTMCTFRLG